MGDRHGLEGVQFAEIRKAVDPAFLALAESLETAYYGPRDENGAFVPGEGWRNGKSSPWNGYDAQKTPAESKALFDQLHGEMWNQHHLALVAENEQQGMRYDVDRLDPMDAKGQRKSDSLRARSNEQSAAIKSALAGK